MPSRSFCSSLPALSTLVVALVVVAAPSRAAEPGDPVVLKFQNRDIVTFRATLGSLTPQARAEAAMRRLSNLESGDFRRSVTIIPYGDVRGIVLGDRMILGIVPDDVDASAGETVEQVANDAAENLRVALASWGAQHRPEVIVRGLTRVVIASASAAVLLFLLRWLRRRLHRLLPSRAERALQKRPLTIFGQDVHGFAIKALRVLVDVAFVVAIAAVLYLWLTFCLRQFPLTEPWGDGLADFLLGTLGMIGLGILHGIPDMIVVVLVLIITRFFVRVVTGLFDAVERGHVKIRGVHPDTADATRRIVTALVWVFGIAIAYPFIPGSNSDAFKGISVLVGLMISLGSSGVINQAMSGMVVVFSRALKAGEYVEVVGYEGTVTEVGALSTKLRTIRNEEINIPNALLVSSTAKNYSRLAGERGAIVYSTAGIGYDAPWRVVHKILVDAALRTPGIRRDPPPFVRQSALESFCVNYVILGYLERPEDRLPVLSNLHANIQDGFNEAGIQIMTPAFESQPAEPVVVPKSKWGEGHGSVERRTP